MTSLRLILSILLLALILSPFAASSDEKKYKAYTDIGPIEKSELSIAGIFSDKDKYHREVLTVEGTVTGLKYKKMFNGRKFTLFGLTDSEKNTINVYARGYVKDITDGSEVRIYGRYSKEKSFMWKKRYNIMKARKIQILDKSDGSKP
ncbi:MAG: hypothetical protein GWO07_08570 [Candidatus Dadabacteria bacterium]|nr:hypothetical protein [Candidatus Dadabacteria bacterium]NIS08800.1 hypothetical protein [Candidatus Dadabacteria bacterium]NIY22150.1 hypothetical protein [Candidatus Dadabacteria bacterium]